MFDNSNINLFKLASHKKLAGLMDYTQALWWKLNDKQFKDAADRLQKNTKNIENADPQQLRRDAAILNKLRTNPVTWKHIKNNIRNNRQYKTFVDSSDVLTRWADPKNKDIETIQKTIKGLNPLKFITNNTADNEFAINSANNLMNSNSPYKNVIPSHYKNIWNVVNPIYAGVSKAKKLINKNINNEDYI